MGENNIKQDFCTVFTRIAEPGKLYLKQIWIVLLLWNLIIFLLKMGFRFALMRSAFKSEKKTWFRSNQCVDQRKNEDTSYQKINVNIQKYILRHGSIVIIYLNLTIICIYGSLLILCKCEVKLFHILTG